MPTTYQASHSGGEYWEEIKDPSDVKSYTIDFSTYLGTDTISGTPTATAEISGITVGTITAASGIVTIPVSSGTAGIDYPIRVEVDTAAGDTYQYTGIVRVRNR